MASIDFNGMEFNRRHMLALALGTSFGLAVSTPASAQGRKLFGIKLPEELTSLLPKKALSAAETVDTILTLERDADLKNLPLSVLSSTAGQPISATDGSIYEIALPRLVALIDRSEFRDTAFAEKAGGLLAQLHAAQRTTPAGLLGFASAPSADLGPNDRSFIDAQAAVNSPPSIELPEISMPAEPAADVAVPPVSAEATLPAPAAVPAPETAPSPAAETATEPAPPTVPPQQAEVAPEVETPAPAKPEPDQPMSRRRDFASLSAEYERLFASSALRPERSETARWHLAMLRNARSRYEQVGRLTGVPWHFIGVIHGLEASFNFRAHLHNGDFPLSRRTRQVPSGRPRVWLPPDDWASSAKDALALLGFTGQSDWSLARTLYRLEVYNGLGYRSYGVPSPYLWSFSNHYARGKFVSDGKWNASARSQQCGAAVMLKLLHDAGEIKLA
jgi:lysozyme family protein